MFSIVVKLGWVYKIIRVVRFSEIHPWSKKQQILVRLQICQLTDLHRLVTCLSYTYHALLSCYPHRYMYITDWGDTPKIVKCTMDGVTPVDLITGGLHWPNGITIDEQTSRLYWTDAWLDRIEMAYLDGTHREVLLSQNVPHPYAIGVYKVNWLVYTEWSGRFRRFFHICVTI